MSQEISAAMVKALRERTNAPMMDCKAALVEARANPAQHSLALLALYRLRDERPDLFS